MIQRTARGKRGNKGQMPFAMIAVTLMVLAGMYGVVAAGIDRVQSNMDSMHDEMYAVGDAEKEVREALERGIGDIILGIGRDASDDGLEARFDKFDARLSDWIDFQFPMKAAGAVVTMISHDIEMGIGALRVACDDACPEEGIMPSCFRADGTADIRITMSSGSVDRTVYISADGMSALPMLFENAALFDQAVTGPWSLITELMSYQLSALAQYRVLSGYGATSEHGDKGTDSIITDEDVRLAYRIALSVAETTYLRTSSSDEFDLTMYDCVDVAELIAFRDGVIEMNLGAVLAQTLVGIVDELVGSWMDYLLLNKLLSIIDTVSDALNRAYNWLCKVFTGSEAETARDYLSQTMAAHGIPERDYRYLLNGVYNVFDIPAVTYDVYGTVITIPEHRTWFAYPDVDVLNWGGWKDFIKNYRGNNDLVSEAVYGMINSIAIGMSNSYGLGVIKVACDPYDSKDFAGTLSDAVREALDIRRNAVEDLMENTIMESKVIDMLYVTMYDMMEKNRNDLFGVNKLRNDIRRTAEDYVRRYMDKEYGTPLDVSVIDDIVDEIMRSDGIAEIIDDYETIVDERMRLFGDILNNVEKKTSMIFKEMIAMLMRYGVDRMGMYPYLEYKMVKLVDEIAELASLNPLAGAFMLSNEDSFLLDGKDGTEMRSYVKLTCDVDIDVTIVSPTKNNENTHFVGFDHDDEASYSALFRIFVKADLTYRAESSSPIMNMLGTYDAAVAGTSHSEFDIAVTVVSGWKLAGVEYEASDTLYGDLFAGLVELLRPIIEPLYELIKLGKSVLHAIMKVVMRAAQLVIDMLMKIFEIVMKPMELLANVLSKVLGSIFDSIITTLVITLKSQTFGFNLFGMRLEIITDILGELKDHASVTTIQLIMPIFGVNITAFINVKKDRSSNFFFSGGVAIEAETWYLKITVDPFMKTKKHLIELNGKFRDTDIYAVAPDVVQYDEMEFRLSDIPGLGSMLSSIPLPIPGVKGSIDAGLELKYNLPYVYGVVINEFELNPPGNDRDNEWVELYNSTRSYVNLDGYMLIPSSNLTKTHTIKNTIIGPGERIVITFPGQFLNNTKESIGLYDAAGVQVDSTPIKDDTRDDDQTWQRETDASAKWVFKKSTKGADNGGQYGGGSPMKAAAFDCLQRAGMQALTEMKMAIIGPDGVALFLKRTLELAIQNAINMIASCLVSASVFIELTFTDYSGSAYVGLRFSLVIGRDIVKDGLTWMVGQITGMMKNIDNPTGMTPKQIISDDVYFQTMFFARITTPKVFGNSLGNRSVTAGLVVECNITAISNLIGRPGGSWRVNIGLVLEDIPPYIVPPMIKVDHDKHIDLWLFRMSLERSKR